MDRAVDRASTKEQGSGNKELRSSGLFSGLLARIEAFQRRGIQVNIGRVSDEQQEFHQPVDEEIKEALKPFEGVWKPLTEDERLAAEKILQELTGKSKDNAEGGARALEILDTTVRWLDHLQQQTAAEKDPNAGIALLKNLLDLLIYSQGDGVETPYSDDDILTPAVKVSVQLYTLLQSIIPLTTDSQLPLPISLSAIAQTKGGQESKLSILLHSKNSNYQRSRKLLNEVQLVLRYAIEKKHEVPKYRVLLKLRDALVGMNTGSEKINVDIGTLAQFLWFVRDREVSKSDEGDPRSDEEDSSSDEVNEYFSQEVEAYIKRLEKLNRLRLSPVGATEATFNFADHLALELNFIATAFQKWKNNETLSIQEKVATYIWTVCDPNGVLNPNSIASQELANATQIFLARSSKLVKSWREVERQSSIRAAEADQRRIEAKLTSLISEAANQLNG